MSPLYEYRCGEGHVTEWLRKYDTRDDAAVCATCDRPATRIPSAHHAEVDGIYSYAPNVGNPLLVEKANMRERGEKWDTLANPKREE